jgi:hypothetical protein
MKFYRAEVLIADNSEANIYAKWMNDIMIIPSPWGDKIARIGDWIIKDIDGSFYPCESSIFEKTYEAVTE